MKTKAIELSKLNTEELISQSKYYKIYTDRLNEIYDDIIDELTRANDYDEKEFNKPIEDIIHLSRFSSIHWDRLEEIRNDIINELILDLD